MVDGFLPERSVLGEALVIVFDLNGNRKRRRKKKTLENLLKKRKKLDSKPL